MRERLRRSDRPDRVFEVGLAAAGQARLLGRRRVLDSTPLYDAMATMDTITLICSAIRRLLRAVGAELAGQRQRLRSVILRACYRNSPKVAGVLVPLEKSVRTRSAAVSEIVRGSLRSVSEAASAADCRGRRLDGASPVCWRGRGDRSVQAGAFSP
jgi:hypothetical protein